MNIHFGEIKCCSWLSKLMLIIVMRKPIHVAIVSAVPFSCGKAVCAIKLENIGESATTVNPQINKKIRNVNVERSNATGDIIQQIPEDVNANVAIFFAPVILERTPATIQEIQPDATTINDASETGSDLLCN